MGHSRLLQLYLKVIEEFQHNSSRRSLLLACYITDSSGMAVQTAAVSTDLEQLKYLSCATIPKRHTITWRVKPSYAVANSQISRTLSFICHKYKNEAAR